MTSVLRKRNVDFSLIYLFFIMLINLTSSSGLDDSVKMDGLSKWMASYGLTLITTAMFFKVIGGRTCRSERKHTCWLVMSCA